MRSVGAFSVVLVAFTLMLAGCVVIPENQTAPGDDSWDAGSNGDAVGEPEPDPVDPPGEDNGQDSDKGSDGNGANGDGPNGNGSDDEGQGGSDVACHEHARPRPAHPSEQEVSSEGDLRCPGHYLIQSTGTGETWQLPTWQVGDWWYYEHEGYDGVGTQCTYHSKETVIADDEGLYGVPIYFIEIKMFDCAGEPLDHDPRIENRSQESLMLIQDDGFIQHNLLFPMREGKSWTYLANSCRDGECTKVTVDDISYSDGSGVLSGLEKWSLTWSFSGGSSEVDFHQEYSVKHNALHYEEMRVSQIPGPLMKKLLLDSSYHDDDDNGGLMDNPLGRL
jgi:hypothetical protein